MHIVKCKGADLLKALSEDEDLVFGRRYAFYIIALATEIDDNAIKWLYKNRRAIDSLTGNSIAFILFYNSVKVYTRTYGDPSEPINPFMITIDKVAKTFLKFHLDTVEVPIQEIRGQKSKQHKDHKKEYGSRPLMGFITAMTYESDELAKFWESIQLIYLV